MSSIAVLPPVNKSRVPWLTGAGAQMAQDVFVTELTGAKKYTVLTGADLAARLRANQLTLTSESSAAVIAAAGKKIGVDNIVLGLFTEHGSVTSFQMRAQVIRSASGQVAWSGNTPGLPAVASAAEFNLRAGPALKALVKQLKAAV
jgi:hypothetical protein